MATFAPPNARPTGFVPIGAFFFFGAVMASYAAFTLLHPGTVLDRGWQLNPVAHVQLLSMGRIMGAPFILLALALLSAGIGWFRRRYWGWMLGVIVISINLIGDLSQLFAGHGLKGMVGVTVAGLLLVYLFRPGTRLYFRRNHQTL
jgi:uncharacterized membrane protein (DUF2068 family)